MKKIYLLALIGCALAIQAQTTVKESRYYNSWRFGLNIGGMWQTADVRSTAGVAGGFTLEKGIFENKTHFFSLAIRGRGLFGNTYGLDFGRNYDVKNNPALNGTYNPAIRYDTVSGNPYIYNNYRTQISEGALELQICFNRLRERTNVLLNLWGGVGITGYRTNVNLLDANNKMYNYSKVDSTGGQSSILASHHDLLDGTYESYARGSKSKNLITFSPSCGIGLGYKFNDYFSIIYEYKLTFPQGNNADLLDGIIGRNHDWVAGSKDYYHYTGVNFLFRIGGKKKTTSSTNLENYTPATTNTVVTTNSVVPTNTINSYSNPAIIVQKPIVNINTPYYSPYNETANQTFTVYARVYNVNHRNEVKIMFNGTEVTNYSWLGKMIGFSVPLNVGSNSVDITATNAAGSDSKSVIINYSGVPPQITITTPGENQHTTTQSLQDVYATILNVESANYISVLFNGVNYSSFNYNAVDHSLYMQLPLTKGANNVQINATNKFGNDMKTQIIYFNEPVSTITATGTVTRPVTVTILDPAANPLKSPSATYLVKAKVTGVSGPGQINVTVNSSAVPFSYAGGMLSFNVNLLEGNNSVSIGASNGKSSDAKSTVITYETMKKAQPPTVTILYPQPSPQTVMQATFDFEAQTRNIKDKSQIEVKFNGTVVYNFNFDPNAGIVDFNTTLMQNANNIFEVKVTNTDGSQMATGIVKQEQMSTGVGIKTKVICHYKDRLTTETITILESQWPAHKAHGDYEGPCGNGPSTGNGNFDPDITICHNQNGIKQTIVIKQSQWPSHQAHGDVMGTCPKINDGGTGVGLDPDITICHNENGTKQTIVIKQSQWPSHQAHGDVMGTCPKINDGGTGVGIDPDISICHKNGDGTETKMIIKLSQWPVHQAHGDYKGESCATTSQTVSTSSIEICHKNGDGTFVTMTIDGSQWPAHRVHGDVLGKCAVTVAPPENKITICHYQQTIQILESEWPTHQAHGDVKGACVVAPPEDKKITICHIPPGNTGNPQTIEINESAWPAHQAHGDSKGACVVAPPEDKKITICHIPPGNTGNPQTIEINESAWPAHQAHGDSKGACVVAPPEDKKITICHIPPGNTGNPQTIEINESAWPAHQAHGDSKGACPQNNNNSNNNSNNPVDKKITICHIPPGNHQNPQTIEINESAWPAHQAHGDTKGACPQNKLNNNDGGGRPMGNPQQESTPGRTMQTQSTTPTPEKTEEQPKQLRPR